MYSISIKSELSELGPLKPIWDDLSNADTHSSLFNSFSWTESWFRHFWEPRHKLHIAIITLNSEPVAFLPLYINGTSNRLMLLGTGEPEHCEVASEYTDFLIRSKNVDLDGLYDFISKHIRSLSNHQFEFVNCLDTSHVYQITNKLSNVRFQLCGKRFQIDLSKDYEETFNAYSKNQRKKSKEILNRFEKSQDITFQSLTNSDYVKNWNILGELHTQDWNLRGKSGAFSDAVFSRFHNYMHESYPEVGQYFAYLRQGEEIVAINHYYRYKNVLHYYTSGSNKKNLKNLSPGILLHNLTISSLNGQNLVYDFMKGSVENSYKEKFCESNGQLFTITVYQRGFVGTLKFIARKLKDKLARVKKAKS